MFGFEKMEVYKIAHQQHVRLLELMAKEVQEDANDKVRYLSSTLSIKSLESLLAFTEGYSHIDELNKSKCYTTSRSCIFGCVAILKIMRDANYIPESIYDTLYDTYESISRMMLNLIRSIDTSSFGHKGGNHKGKGKQGDIGNILSEDVKRTV